MKKNEVKTEKTYIEGVRINFLYVDKYSFGGEWYMPESKIPYSMLRYITAGKAIFIIDGKIAVRFRVQKTIYSGDMNGLTY